MQRIESREKALMEALFETEAVAGATGLAEALGQLP